MQLSTYLSAVKTHKGGPHWGGVYSNNELKKPDPNYVYILNLEDSDEPGSHWTLLYNKWYFDPFGVVPTKEIQPFVRAWNQVDYQGLTSEACGHYCSYVASRIIQGQTPWTGALIPYKPQLNEHMLQEFFRGTVLEP